MKKLTAIAMLMTFIVLSGCTGGDDKKAEEEQTNISTVGANVEAVMDYKALSKMLLAERHNKDVSEVTVNILFEGENHVRGEHSFTPGGSENSGIFLAAQTEGTWKIVFDGNGQIECATMNSYSFPADMIEDCV